MSCCGRCKLCRHEWEELEQERDAAQAEAARLRGAMKPRYRFTKITADMIRAAAHYGRFGESDPAQVVCEGLVSISGGFRTGGTVTSILKGMGLIGKKSGQPTKMGRLFLFDITNSRNYVEAIDGKVSP